MGWFFCRMHFSSGNKHFFLNSLGNRSKQFFDEKSERALKKQYHGCFFCAQVFKPKKPHDMVSFFFAGFTLFRNVHFLQDKEQAWTGISWLPRPWELARILPNFIFYVNQASKPSFNEFSFFQKISRISSRVNYAVSGLRGRLLIKNIIFIIFLISKIIFSIKSIFRN